MQPQSKQLLITKLGSSSAGNCIVVDDGESAIMLDCGIRLKTLTEKGVRLSGIAGCLISHEHGDHCKYHHELTQWGLPVFSSYGTLMHLLDRRVTKHYGYNVIEPLKSVKIDSWMVTPFEVRHDARQPYGFLCRSLYSGAKLCYIVDSSVIKWDFKGVTHWLIEANHSIKSVEEMENKELAKRIANNHMSIENCLRFLTSTDLSETQEIHLLHLSRENSDQVKFIQQIETETGIPVYT